MYNFFCPCKYPHAGRACKPEDERTPCKECGEKDCSAYFDTFFPTSHSFSCAQREIDKLKAKIAELEADPGRFANCSDCGTELVTSAVQCSRCSGVAPLE